MDLFSLFDMFEEDDKSPLTGIDWEKSMSYQQGRELMIRAGEYYKKIKKEKTIEVSHSVSITCPGKKKAMGDYRADVYGHTLTHKEMCLKLFSYITENVIDCEKVKQILEETYIHGYVMDEDDSELIRELKKQIYWLTLQEDINYPIESGYLGHKHPLLRYAEALIVSQKARDGKDVLTGVYDNADNSKPKSITLLNTDDVIVPNYYRT